MILEQRRDGAGLSAASITNCTGPKLAQSLDRFGAAAAPQPRTAPDTGRGETGLHQRQYDDTAS